MNQSPFTRREFIRTSAVAGLAAGVCGPVFGASAAENRTCPPVAVFSKIYQELKLDFEDSASLTAEAGLEGIDPPVRPDGEVAPERAVEELPRYVEALRKHTLTMPLLTTAITSTTSPRAEELLRTAKRLGARFYRLGFNYRTKTGSVSDQIREFRAKLKDLAALNKQIGIGALIQNHSSSGASAYLAGDLSEMRQIVEGFEPNEIGVAFDIGHALNMHGDGWREHFEALKPHVKVAYIKDVTRQKRWVPFGEGEISKTGYFKLLKQMGYGAPFSLHVEFDWTVGGQKTRAALLKALRESAKVLRRWYEEA